MNPNSKPYICFNGNEFTKFLTFVKSSSSSDLSRYIYLHVEDNYLVCRSFDGSSYLEYLVPIFNSENLITEPMVVLINDLLALIKCSPDSNFYIRNNYSQYEFKVIGESWLPFQIADIDASSFIINEPIETIGQINSSLLRDTISNFLGYIQNATYTNDNCIKFNENQAYVTSRFSGVITSGKFINMTLQRYEASRLKSLLKDDFNVKISRTIGNTERLIFEGINFKFTIIAVGSKTTNLTYKDDINDYIIANYSDLCKLANCSNDYIASKHSVGLAVRDGKLIFSIKNNLTADHASVIESATMGNINNVNEVTLPTPILLKNLKVFQDSHLSSINIYFSKEYIILFDDAMQAIIDICN